MEIYILELVIVSFDFAHVLLDDLISILVDLRIEILHDIVHIL